MTRAEMLAVMDADEFTEWMHLEQAQPFGECGAWLRNGILCATIANANRGKGQRPFKPSDFMPEFYPPQQRRPQTFAEIRDVLRKAAAASKKRRENHAQSRRRGPDQKAAGGNRQAPAKNRTHQGRKGRK